MAFASGRALKSLSVVSSSIEIVFVSLVASPQEISESMLHTSIKFFIILKFNQDLLIMFRELIFETTEIYKLDKQRATAVWGQLRGTWSAKAIFGWGSLSLKPF